MSEREAAFGRLVSLLVDHEMVVESEVPSADVLPGELSGKAQLWGAVTDGSAGEFDLWWCAGLEEKWAFYFSFDDCRPTNLKAAIIDPVVPVLAEYGIEVEVGRMEWLGEATQVPLNGELVECGLPDATGVFSPLGLFNSWLADVGSDRRFCFRGRQWTTFDGARPGEQQLMGEFGTLIDLVPVAVIDALATSEFVVPEGRPVPVDAIAGGRVHEHCTE